jgi:hypothetical protein
MKSIFHLIFSWYILNPNAHTYAYMMVWLVGWLVFSANFSNNSAISWRFI